MTTHTFGVSGTITGLANNQQGNVISAALATMVQSGTAPTAASTGLSSIAGLAWHDTSANQYKIRDQADTAWIILGTFDETLKTFTSSVSTVSAIQGAAKNLKLSSLTGSEVVTADEIILETTGNAYAVVRTVSVTIATGASGANGLDTGTFAANTWYSVWVIFNGTTTAGLISLSATAPTMPSGYTHKARVGWVRSNATPALIPTLQYGRTAQYVVDASVLTVPRKICANVGTYSPSAPTYSAQAISTFVPTTASEIIVSVGSSGSTNGRGAVAPNANSSGSESTNPPPISRADSSGTQTPGSLILQSTNIYVATESSASVYCSGWVDSL